MSCKIIAHRGGTDKYPELTIEGCRYSLQMGADFVEIDIRFTADGVPVISHDDNALRSFGCEKTISELTSTEFLALRHTGDPAFGTHSLEDVFKCGIAPILFHVKEGGERLKKILNCISKYHYEQKVVLGVLSSLDVRIIKEHSPYIRVLAFMPDVVNIEEFILQGADIIRLWEAWVTDKTIETIKKMNKQVWIMAGFAKEKSVGYTSETQLKQWFKMGADGVLINEVIFAKKIIK